MGRTKARRQYECLILLIDGLNFLRLNRVTRVPLLHELETYKHAMVRVNKGISLDGKTDFISSLEPLIPIAIGTKEQATPGCYNTIATMEKKY
ncbi:MAG: hypothetical protein U5K54_05840 [Cytophagales bacterium]|nr:hypothetical protein [Cytophagales bacterium]